LRNVFEPPHYMWPIIDSRNLARKVALERGFDLWVVDSDVKLPPDARSKIEATEGDIIGGLVKTNLQDYAVYKRDEPLTPKSLPHSYLTVSPNTGPVECAAVGGGCMFIRNHVLKEIEFSDTYNGNKYIKADDQIYCAKAYDMGFKIVAQTDVICLHSHEPGVWI